MKDAVLRRLAENVKALDRPQVVRWIAGDFWFSEALANRFAAELRAWKVAVLETLDAISPAEILAACREARPDLADLWDTPEAKAKMEEEWRRGRARVEKM